MKRPTMLVEAALRQAELDLDLSVERDVATLQRRFKHEGLSFLTITLASLSDALERGLESGRFSCPSNFSRHGSLPRFMGGFFKRVFESDGELRHDVDPSVILHIRQVCRFFKKLKIDCSSRRNARAVQHFIDVEAELRHDTPQIERKELILDQISGILWSQVFPEIDPLDLVCRHGPGNTADRLSPNGRRHIRKWNQRSEHLFPSDLHCFPNYGFAAQTGNTREESGCYLGPRFLDLADEESVRVVFVPKTQTAPRVIALEPSHMQFTQQSVKDLMYSVLENHALTKRSIHFKDQSYNQALAHSGSIDKRTSTLDLKDASDRVHLHLVQRIFKTSGLLQYLEDARSLHATLPNGRNIVLSKYASMGSALCFPVEACVFYTLVQCAMHQLDGVRPSSRSIDRYSRKIVIYGDDIIVPVEYTDVVVRFLESFSLRVNVNKSFSKGNFRESCGADYYKGEPVNPIYARTVPHDDAHDWGPDTVMSWTKTADLFYMRGQWIVAQAIRDMVASVLRRSIPTTQIVGAGVAFFSYVFTTNLRWNADLQCYKQKRLVYQPILRKDDINGHDLSCLNLWAERSYVTNSKRIGGFAEHHASVHDRRHASFTQFGCDISSSPGNNVPVLPPGEEGNRPFHCDGLQTVLSHDDGCRQEACVSQDVDTAFEHTALAVRLRPEMNFSEDYRLTEEIQSDPLAYLTGRSVGIDFSASTKRGCFKSKSRWISI